MAASAIKAKNKKRAVLSKPRVSPRRMRERRANYRASRWKIPNVTPLGSDEPVSKTLPRAVKRIAETLQPEKIILFGSYAYGNPTPDSDVDLLVVMENQKSHRENYLAVSECLIPRPFGVDIVLRTPQELSAALARGDFFVDEITRRGKILYEGELLLRKS